jgi:hypothetical protein
MREPCTIAANPEHYPNQATGDALYAAASWGCPDTTASQVLHRLLRPPQFAADAGQPEHTELGQPHRLRGTRHGRPFGRQALEEAGVDVLGPKDHKFCQSIYFFNPNGIRLEMTVRTEEPGQLDRMEHAAGGALAAWNARKQRKYGVPA